MRLSFGIHNISLYIFVVLGVNYIFARKDLISQVILIRSQGTISGAAAVEKVLRAKQGDPATIVGLKGLDVVFAKLVEAVKDVCIHTGRGLLHMSYIVMLSAAQRTVAWFICVTSLTSDSC